MKDLFWVFMMAAFTAWNLSDAVRHARQESYVWLGIDIFLAIVSIMVAHIHIRELVKSGSNENVGDSED